jgi:phospholipase C
MKFTSKLSVLLTGALTALPAHAGYPGPIKHVVVIFQENRTPDNLFQGLCTFNKGVPGCGAANTQYNISSVYVNSKGVTDTLSPVGLANDFDLDHSHGGPNLDGTVSGWAFEYTNQGISGKPGLTVPPLCGANVFGCTGPVASQFMYVYNTPVTNSDGKKGGLLDPYITLATSYGWANYMYQTNQGPSYPAHQFIFGGSSAPTPADDAAGIFVAENNSSSSYYGCASGESAQLIVPNGSTTFPFGTEITGNVANECFTRNAMDYLLGLTTPPTTWTYYAEPPQSSLWVAPNSLSNICKPSTPPPPPSSCTGPDWIAGGTGFVDMNPPDVLSAISSCTLAQVSWVTPAGEYSDHAHDNQGQGPSWVASIVNAIGTSTTCDGGKGYWDDTIIFLTWDDWGGWYDHVPPIFQTLPSTNQEDYQLGFRVPLIVISAYSVTPGYISNLQFDFGSILKAIEEIFGLGSLGFADARATNDLHDFFNFTLAPSVYKTIPSPLGATFFTTMAPNEVSPPDTD